VNEMSSSPLSPRVLQGALVCLDPVTFAILKIIAFPYNPETLCRKLEPGAAAPPGTSTIPPILPTLPRQEIRFTLHLDATDRFEVPEQNPAATQYGMYPLMSAIELLMYPPNSLQTALTLLVWGRNRIVPVRVAELQIVEEMFDPTLNPIRVQVAVTLLVQTATDFPTGSGAGKDWDAYLANLERMAELAPAGSLAGLGVTQL
jgi:hypothetical protein